MTITTRFVQRSIVFTLGLLLVGIPGRASAQERDASKLISLKKCAMCHKKDDKGNQYGSWQKSTHAKAFETLGTDEAKAAATKLGIEDAQKSGKCLKCHSTAYYYTEELQSEDLKVEDGVTCQSCHGPGADYKKKSIMESREDSIANGMVYPAKEKSCTLCHNENSPTWKTDRYTTADGQKVGFDPDQAYEKIKHERPAK